MRAERSIRVPARRLLVPALALFSLVAASAAAEDAAGRWRGTVELAGGEVEVVVVLERTGEAWSGTLDAPGHELAGLELTDVAVSEGTVAFTAAALGDGVRLTADLSAGGDILVGESAEGPPGAPPATDIFLFALGDLDGWEPEPPINVTDRDGYDNQPHFLPDGSAFLYTSIRDGQADIYRYELATGATARVTDTPESEYSPTPMPWGGSFSTVRVEADGTQRLWSFPLAGGDGRLLIENVQPVGYHEWLGRFAVALFVLGDPPTLEVWDVTSGETRWLAEGIGRSLHAIPGTGRLSFVRKVGDLGYIEAYDPWISKGNKLIETRQGSEDLTWTADGRILMGEGSQLFAYRPGPRAEIDPWVEVADLEPFGVRGITRLALSPDQRHLAVVGEREVPPPPSPEPRPLKLRREEDG